MLRTLQRCVHGRNGRTIIFTAENSRSCDKDVGPSFSNRVDIMDFNSAVHFQINRASCCLSMLVNALARLTNFMQRFGDEGLTAEARID